MKRIRRLWVPPEWGLALRGDPGSNHPSSRPRRWPFYLLVAALVAVIAAGAMQQYFINP